MNLSNQKKAKSIFLWMMNFLYLLCFITWVSLNWSNDNVISNYNEKLFPWVCVLIIIQMLSFKLKNITFYDFGFWITLNSYLFMFGYLFRDVFKLPTELIWNPITSYGEIELFHSYVYIICSLELFLIGYFLVYKQSNGLKKIDLNFVDKDEKLYSVGIFLLIIGGITRLINDGHIISVTQSANSYSAYSEAASSGLWDDLAFLMLPGIFCIFFSGCIKDRTKKILLILVLLYLAAMMMLTGSRKLQIFSILSLLLAYNFSLGKRRITVPRLILYSILSIILMNILIIIRDYRFELSSIVPVAIDNILSLNLFGNLFGEIFAETGITILSVASIVKIVPSIKPYQYGLTFLRTIPSFLPIGWLAKDLFNNASSTYVINSYTKLPVGSSFLGDLYWNWGFLGGILAAFFSGIIAYKFLYSNKKDNLRKEYALYFSFFSQLIILVRAELMDVYRPIIMIYIVVFIFYKCKITIKRRGKKYD